MSLTSLDNFILGIDEEVSISALKNTYVKLIELKDVEGTFKKRKRDSHKGSYGKVGFVTGSKGMAGAAVLNLRAAFRCGSGLIKAFIPEEIYSVVESMSLETVTSTYDINNFSFGNLQEEIIDYSDVVATGSGCTNIPCYGDILNYLLDNCIQPLVIDAEGINQLNLNSIKNHKYPIILTPHYGEMARLIKKDIKYVRKDIIKKSLDFSMQYNVYLVLKGARTVIACPDGQVYINTTGNPGMATAGSGDVLTGLIASLIGQGFEIKNALKTAVYIHGLAGDIGAAHLGECSLTAGTIIEYLPEAIMSINKRIN
ncbi:MAG TPA: NAD(P)H-hydrate dehydratase [Tissierellia bacterium]|nr:NAD(P)H-hydrate dehydratase [Tissierellia bacterium]